jgi:peptidoglycan/LPS O-acetylase OafA/YrhL
MIEQAKKTGKMMWICVALIAVAAVLLVAGVTGAWVILFIVPCMLMMGMMMWMMMGGTGHGSDSKK